MGYSIFFYTGGGRTSLGVPILHFPQKQGWKGGGGPSKI